MSTTTTCPDEGTLRAFLDHEAPNHDAIARHARGCLSCTRNLRELRADATLTTSALNALDEAPRTVAGSTATRPAGRRTRRLAAVGTAAAVSAVMVATPIGQSVAKDVLGAFRSKQVVAVDVTSTDLGRTEKVLEQLGTLSDPGAAHSNPRRVADVAAAQRMVGYPVSQVGTGALPSGLNATPQVEVTPARRATFVFDAAKVRAYLRSNHADPKIPAGLQGERLTIEVPSTVAVTYSGERDRRLILGFAEPVRADVKGGLTMPQLKDFLMGVPGVPSSLVNQLGDVDPLHGSLPVPIPVDRVRGDQTTVSGHSAVQMSQPGLGSGIIWEEKNRLVGVAGTYELSRTKDLATALARP